MIRPLRSRHRLLIAGVAVVVAPLAVAALMSRPAPPVAAGLPVGLSEPPAAAIGDGIELPTTPPLAVRPAAAGTLLIEAARPGARAVEGAALLLYWAPAGTPSLDGAILLGPLRGGERQLFALPDERATEPGEPGELIVYSLGHGEEVARAPWPPAAAAGVEAAR